MPPGKPGGFYCLHVPQTASAHMPRQSGFLIRLTCVLLLLPFGQIQANDYLNELLTQARHLRLAEHSEWHGLMHYRQRHDGYGVISLADSSNFFLAENGKYDPEAELEATLAAFFSSVEETDKQQNPQCAFIARYEWLKSKLSFDQHRLPKQTCHRFENWFQAINPGQVTLIFPAAYINNPSSMFGHTLLRIDMPQQDERTRLASYAVNYAAETNETNGVVFAVKGLMGGYPGYFSIMPYYEKVKEYSDIENRDIWEYQLTLTKQEIRRLLEHAWELGPVRFDYYFFDENCSYQLLALFDVARPGLDLSQRFQGWAIPSDTVREVLSENGLLKQAVYRPSSLTLLQHRLRNLDDTEQQLALELSQGNLHLDNPALGSLSDDRRAQVLESAYDYLQYQFNTGKWPRETAAPRSLALLRARSQILVQHTTSPLSAPGYRPDQGHETARMAIYHGLEDDKSISDFYIRPAYHDLLDADAGYQIGAQINFFDFHFRHYHEQNSTQLESFTLVDIFSLSPRDRFFKPVSWRVSTGLERIELPDSDNRPLVVSVRGGGGPSYRLGTHQIISLMLEGTAVADNELPAGYALAIGPSAQWLWGDEKSRWKFQLRSRWQAYRDNLEMDEVEHQLQTNLALDKDLSLRLSFREYGVKEKTSKETKLGLHWYF